MSEIINTFAFDNPYDLIPMERAEFYEEQSQLSEPTKAVEVVNVLLFNEIGEIILQKRSHKKNHNPWLLDKSIWGHVTHGNDADYTVMVETVQELQVPSIVLRDKNDFEKTYELLKWYIHAVAIIKRQAVKLIKISKMIAGKEVMIGNKAHVYFWVYAGSVKNVDYEAKGILFYSLEELEEDMKQNPNIFTQDMQYYMSVFRKDIYEFRDFIISQRV